MPQTIEFEGVEHEFPDDATDDEIGNALSALDQSRGATAASADSSPAGVGSIPTPATSNPIADAARRVGAGITEATMTAAAGLTRLGEFTPAGLLGSALGLPSPAEPIREFAGAVQERARSDYGVDPARDKELVSKVIAGATSLAPILASGPAAPLTAAGLMGESVRQEAEAAGATEGQKTAAFAGGATIGVVSEALLGIPALLRSAKAAGATDAVMQSIARQAVTQGLKNTAREASQEAIEQVSTNLLANTVVGYDPTRETSAGVLEAAGIGALVGGPVGALVQTAATLDARAQADLQQLQAEAESVAAGAPTGEPNAEPISQATQLYEPVLNAQGTPEVEGQVPAAEGGAGIPSRGQGPEVRAADITREQAEAPDVAAVESIKAQSGVDTETAVTMLAEARNRFANQPPISEAAPEIAAAERTPAAEPVPLGLTPKTKAALRKRGISSKAIDSLTQEQADTILNPPKPTFEIITPSEDTFIGTNSAGEKLYERSDGMRYRMRHDSPNRKPNGYPDFGGDLALIGEDTTVTEPTPMPDTIVKAQDAVAFGKANQDAATREAMQAESDALTARHREMYERDELPDQAEVHRIQMLNEALQWEAKERQMQQAQAASEPDVDPHLRTDKEVQTILGEQSSASEVPAMKAPEFPSEAAAAGGTGGRRSKPPPAIGTTPRGDRNWLRIPAWYKRVGRGLFTEGARHVLARTKNRVGQALAKATRRHVDVEQELFGQHEKILRDAVRGIPASRQEALWTEVSQHIRDTENGRPTTPLAPDAQRVLDAWYDVGKSTGDIARANNVMVWDATRGAYRPMGTVTNYIPRMFSREVEQVLRDPDKNPTLFNNLAQAIATHRGISLPDAAKELQKVAGRFSSNDFHGNLELARLEQLPEIFYEYDLRNLAARYLPAFSERMAQIIAYGQRLGPREQPMRMNLWDVARREARDETTQQWLNAAEDQATGFRPKNEFERNARRLQAIGNATLLSDPTTTVVRNLISGLSVTAERYGVVRSLRALREMASAASGMDAREVGALRDDIGSFLGAEQLGDSALDNFIRSIQQTALKFSGFSPSENVVRTHGAITASAFARDSAKALSTSPTSRLAREALAYFKRLDVNPELIVAEGGNWRTGPETRKFIRSSVRESQGGYRFDQVPIWGGTTVGRFLYQYGRWGIQRAGDIFRNTIRPAIGETVEFRGQRMTHRNVMPLIRLGMLTAGLGETFAAIAAMLFGRDRRDASLEEIGEALSEDEMQAVAMMGERVINDILMAGTLGLIGQPLDYFKALKDQTRIKNPLDPPSIAGVKTVVELATKAKDQGGTLTKRDLLDAASGLARGPKNVTDVARSVADDKLYESQNDQRTLRNAARRWAKTQGMDVASKISFDTIRKSLNAPVFEAINDALLTGDPTRAKQLRDEFVNSKKTTAEKKKAREAVHSSVEGRHPFRAGPFTADKYRKQFTQWADKNLSAPDREQIRRVIETYDKASREAGL